MESGSATTVGEWLTSLKPQVPEALAMRLDQLLAPQLERPAAEVATVCLDTGINLLSALLAMRESSRDSALDLLAVDALVTCAFQAAAANPASVDSLTKDAMTRIAQIPSAHKNAEL